MTRMLRFGVVGAAAALTHFLAVVALVSAGLAQPLAANVFGFLVAFWVSYFGQRNWTFRERATLHRRAVPLYFLVAAGSFLLNQSLFYLLLRFTVLPYTVALVLVLVIVAAVTYLLSRHWVFRAR